MWFRGQSCARGTGGMGYNHRTGQSEARTVLPLNSQYFMLFREFSRRHLAPSNAVLVASPGPWFSAAGRGAYVALRASSIFLCQS